MSEQAPETAAGSQVSGLRSRIYRARKVYRSDGRLLDNGAVVCRDERIAAVAPWAEVSDSRAEVTDLGEVLLLPGLVNAHTHLRLSHLKGAIAPTKDFVGWLAKIAWRARLLPTKTAREAITSGAREMLEGGVTTAVEIDIDGLSAETLRLSPLRLLFAHECIDLDPARAEQTASQLMETVTRLSAEPLRRKHGIAPHAPYSVSRELWESLARKLKDQPTFLNVHLAESAEEVEMFAEARGKMLRRLRLLGFLPRAWQAPNCSPVTFLEQTGILATPGIAAHCGHADDADVQRLARWGWTVAFCPGTHEYFDRPPFPLERLRRAGVPVCVATDSAASNTSLSMMDEMRRLARNFRDLSASDIVAAATAVPAQAIGWGKVIGRIEPGFCADLSAWSPCCEGDRLDRTWFEQEPPTCVATIIGGQIVAR